MDWSKTNKKLCIFIPNYKRDEYLRYSLDSIYNNTNWSKDDFEIVIGCDGTDTPYTSAHSNVSSFALNNGSPRNGCFIRNYFIKRCQSEQILMFDPENMFVPLWEPDPIYGPIDILEEFSIHTCYNSLARIGNVATTTKEDYEQFKQGKHPTLNVKELDCHTPYHWHHGVCIATKNLKENPYDERFNLYGFEDIELRNRLLGQAVQEMMIRSFCSVHLYHDPLPNVYNEVEKMRQLFVDKMNKKTFTNGNGWGNG